MRLLLLNMKGNKIMKDRDRILAVDDDPNNIAIIEELLAEDYDLRIARTGEEALQISLEFQPDIVLLDLMMPGMNGYEVCRQLRKHYATANMKIIMISARAMKHEKLEGYDAGADDYITKPFDGDVLLAKLNACLQHNTPC